MCNVRYDSSWNSVDIDIDYLETLSCKERSATNDIGYACNFIVGLWMSFWNIHVVLLLNDEEVYINV